MDKVSSQIAQNIKHLRTVRGLSQVSLSHAAEIPRATLAHLESGSANPTVHVLLRVATALQVSVDELLGAPRDPCQFFAAKDVSAQRRGEARLRRILPPGSHGVEFDRLELPPRCRMVGVPHRAGTREYFTCEQESFELIVAGDKYKLFAGDVLAFRGDQKHSYVNPLDKVAVGFSVVIFEPVKLS